MNDNGGKAFDPVSALRCRDDILQAMYWMRGEGFGEEADVASLVSFLVLDETLLREQLNILVEEGHLKESGGCYRLTELGAKEGGRRFADEFSGLQLMAHGDCGPECPTCKGVPRDACVHCAPYEEPAPLGPRH